MAPVLYPRVRPQTTGVPATHANLLTVEAVVKETFRVRSARLKEFGSAGIIPHALREGVRYYFIPRNAFLPDRFTLSSARCF
jgi:hypothetical protein